MSLSLYRIYRWKKNGRGLHYYIRRAETTNVTKWYPIRPPQIHSSRSHNSVSEIPLDIFQPACQIRSQFGFCAFENSRSRIHESVSLTFCSRGLISTRVPSIAGQCAESSVFKGTSSRSFRLKGTKQSFPVPGLKVYIAR